MTVGELRYCPECRQRWPRGADHDLRSFRWLDDLPRAISPSNIDCILHDGGGGRSRFLVFETKRPNEDVQGGQARLLRALAAVSPERIGVRILHGTAGDLAIHRVTADAIENPGTRTTPSRVRAAVAAWLGGSLWRDAEAGLASGDEPRHIPVHVCAWTPRDSAGASRCIHCGAAWSQTA